ncbi:alanine racemase [Streptomyces sp. V3I7]|uniref:alanine racemase n=1 Tax=Streptomyces sp. V3I7 TaxID=3042278 RepID=UPI00277FF0F8|nr:alanine racemase [Streptomyces sp. V3I7]MDQ0989519.1 D-serine deaminase-like pyridoxal phosphate-dependent protein [Streptomyces sp. V3I7]
MISRLPEGLTTPALVVDVDVLEGNIARMAEAGRGGGFALRPHAKTHKCPPIAERQRAAGAVGLTVATIGEAEVFAGQGFTDLFIAYPLWADGDKARRLRRLAETVSLRLTADSADGARQLGAAVRGADRPVELLVEIDSGHHRTGVAPVDAAAVGKAAADAGLDVRGVFTFPGHGYGYGPQARAQAARDEERALTEAAEALRAAGLAADVISGGSTPTAALADQGAVNELRPGVYVFNDATQIALGSCTPDDLALVAAATVVSTPAPDRFVLDTGSKVLGTDVTPWVTGHGYLPDFPDASITALSEHHATVVLPEGTKTPPLGSRIAVAPNHVCSAVNLVDELVITRQGEIVDRWAVAARGANA